MVRLIPSHVFVKDPVDVWNKEHTIGNAELAARLGSPVTFDRRGTVFSYDDFESSSFEWTSGFAGSGSITLSNEHPFRGDGCMKIVTGNVVNNYSQSMKWVQGAAKNLVGIEAHINMYDTLDVAASISMVVHTGSRIIYAGIQLEQQGAGGLSYRHDNTPLTAFTHFNDDFLLSTVRHYPVKFVIDVENEKYVRCMFGGTEIDMSAYTPHVADYLYAPCIIMHPQVVNKGTTYPKTYFDDIILTIEEPV